MTNTSEQVAEALAHKTQEITVSVRMTPTLRAKLDRARGKLPLSEWIRQVIEAAADGEPARTPSFDVALFRRLEEMIKRLGLRYKSREVWEEELLRSVYEVREHLYRISPDDNFGVDRMHARDGAQQEFWRFEKSLEKRPRANPDPVDHDIELKELRTAVYGLKDTIQRRNTPPPSWARRVAAKAEEFRQFWRTH